MAINPHQFRAFAQIVREGSFSEAARKLGVTQSAITQHVSNLEKTVGSKLFLRGKHGLSLTYAGSDLFELAERFVTLEQLIEEKIAGYSDMHSGRITIIANAPQPALRQISRFTDLYPDIEVEFSLHDWTTATSLLRTHAVDVAFITAPNKQSDCIYHKISDAIYVLYCRKDHRLAGRDHVSLQELSSETLLLPEEGSLTLRVATAALQQLGVTPRRIVKTATFPVMKEAIQDGIGLGIFLSDSTANNDNLVALPIREMPQSYEIFVAVPGYKRELRLIRSFLQSVLGPQILRQTT